MVEAKSRAPLGQSAPRVEALHRKLARHGGRLRAEISKTQRAAFVAAIESAGAGPWIVDAGCGTGRSTLRLAEIHPGSTLLGIDRSEVRLSRGSAEVQAKPGELPCARVHFVRAQLEPFFALARRASVVVSHLYLLYPNPYAKPGQQGRRLYARPGFGDMVACARHIELRTNWEIYAHEFAAALCWLGREAPAVERLAPRSEDRPLSDFEAKYRASSLPLWRVRSQAPADP